MSTKTSGALIEYCYADMLTTQHLTFAPDNREEQIVGRKLDVR